MSEAHTVLSVLRAAETWLQGRGVEAPRRSAELLLSRVTGLSRLQVYLAHDRPLGVAERDALRRMVARRGAGEPLAYVLGDQEFLDLTLEVNPAVMIPRPETEGLVALALERLPPGEGRCLDLGTGSGAIAIALAVARPGLRIWAVDISSEALAVAQRNARRHGVDDRIRFLHGSFWEPVPAMPPFDLVVSNPPYVDPDRPELLAEDVRRHEPATALFSVAGDPASCYREIISGVGTGLRPGGALVLETGELAAQPALQLLQNAPELLGPELRADLQGLPRYLLAVRCT